MCKNDSGQNEILETFTVSICMITYGHAKFIRKAVNSILTQKCGFNIELVISNDNSPDNTNEIIRGLIQNHEYGKNIKYFNQDNNLGVAKNLIFALNQCSGKYIAICEGDDFWNDPLKLQKQINFLERYDKYVVTYHDAQIVDENDKLIKENKLPPSCRKDFTRDELKKGAYLLFLTLCFKNVIKNYPPQMYSISTPDTFLTSILGNFGEGKFMNDIIPSCYRLHSGGVWGKQNKIRKLKMRLDLFKSLYSFYLSSQNEEITLYYKKRIRGTYRPLILEHTKYSSSEDFLNDCKNFIIHEKGLQQLLNIFFIQKMCILFIYFFFFKRNKIPIV